MQQIMLIFVNFKATYQIMMHTDVRVVWSQLEFEL